MLADFWSDEGRSTLEIGRKPRIVTAIGVKFKATKKTIPAESADKNGLVRAQRVNHADALCLAACFGKL